MNAGSNRSLPGCRPARAPRGSNRDLRKSLLSLFPSVLLSLLLFALPATVFAHRLDEYLQATLVVIDPDRIRLQINLTPGVAIAEQVLALIDRDRDGVISTNEIAAYSDLFKRDLIVRLDQRNLELKLTASYFAGPAELRTGWGFIQIEFSAAPGSLTAGAHKLTIENRHLPGASVYLVNAAQPASASVQITKQIRNQNQSTGEIQFTFQPPPNSSRAFGLFALLLILVVSVSAGAQRARKSSPR
jgi:hypothetical protein